MTRPVLIQILIGAALVAAGAAATFTQQGDVWRLAGAVIATLGVIVARRAILRMRRR
jgi:drug/metabolite transporter (DMT)-like permease